MENKELKKTLKKIAEKCLQEGMAFHKNEFIYNNEVLFAQIISKEFARLCSVFIKNRNTLKYNEGLSEKLFGSESEYKKRVNITVEKESVDSLNKKIEKGSDDINQLKIEKSLYEKHDQITKNYSAVIATLSVDAMKKGIRSLLWTLRNKGDAFLLQDKKIIVLKILTARFSEKERICIEDVPFKEGLIFSIADYRDC